MSKILIAALFRNCTLTSVCCIQFTSQYCFWFLACVPIL